MNRILLPICKTLDIATTLFPSTYRIITIEHINIKIPPIKKTFLIKKYKILLPFKINPARNTDPNILASTCTLGSHICNPKIGSLARITNKIIHSAPFISIPDTKAKPITREK